MTFRIAPDVDLPSNAATQTFAFLARRGSGKTYSAGVLAESLLTGGAQVVVVDPVGVWWGLRLAADGVSPGIDIPVFGGLRGDIPLEPTAGAVVARLVAEQRTSVVLDVSMFTGADQRRFVTDFARELFDLKKENRGPIHVMFDEAQEFFPQNVLGEAAPMVGAVLKLWKIGRNFGIGGTLISQRPQEVNKSALNLTECLVTGQLTGPQERKAIAGWVTDAGMDRGALDELPRLPIGTVYLWSPQWLGRLVKTRFVAKRTFDASKTPEENDLPPAEALKPIDLARVQKAMALTIEHVKANDPKALRARIKLLEQLTTIPRVDDVKVQQALAKERDAWEERAVSAERAEVQYANAFEAVRRIVAEHPRATDHIITYGEPLDWDPDADKLPLGQVGTQNPKGVFNVITRPAAARVSRAPDAEGDGAQRMLRALASRHPTPLSKAQLGVLAVIKPSGGSFGTYLSRLYSQGLIDKDGQFIKLTKEGAARHDGGGQLEGAALVETWQGKLSGKAKDMLGVLVIEGPMTTATLAARVGMELAGGSFSTYMSRLKSNGLIERCQDGFRAVRELTS